MTKIAVRSTYRTDAIGYAELPDGKTWDDVFDWHIKWDTLHVQFKGAPYWHEIELNSDSSDDTDRKWPIRATVHPFDEDEVELASQEN